MIVAYWIVAGLLAAAMLMAGAMKTVRHKDQLRESGMEWTDGFSAVTIRLIGIAEVLGAVGLILPPLTGIAPVLAPVAAIALAVLMAGATVLHIRRNEKATASLVLMVLSIAAAVLGFLAVI
ncbi:MAG: DoxX family protein [Microbacterium sp.]|nr:DoxX family protein [Microbacterium sp.]|tara:strand:+ start:688 stop:1053 length:366 start_codon:yes stop_codon:yes gene_type:complete